MNENEIKLKRTESILRELIPESLSSLNDEALVNLSVVEVICSRGKYDADVYLDQTALDDNEKRYILKHIRKVSPYIENYCKNVEGWFKCPKLHFKFDDGLQKQTRMEELFAQIEKELKNGQRDTQ